MKPWIIISPDGVTVSPNEEEYENFQVLGFITAETEELALDMLKTKYPYVNGSGFDEVWIYPLESGKPYISYLDDSETPEDEFGDEVEEEMFGKIPHILKETGNTNIIYDYCSRDSYYFEGYSDVLQETHVDIRDKKISIYDRDITEKQYVHFGNFKL